MLIDGRGDPSRGPFGGGFDPPPFADPPMGGGMLAVNAILAAAAAAILIWALAAMLPGREAASDSAEPSAAPHATDIDR